MEFAAIEVQIFVSLALVLGSVFVALLTDFLKGNNEALRERNIELVVRQEERKHSAPQVAVQQPQYVPAQEQAPQPVAEPELPNVAAAEPVVATEPVMASASVAEDIAPPSEEWATSDELEAVDAIAARIRESIDSRPVPEEEPAAAQAEEEEEEEILAPEAATAASPIVEPEPEPAIEVPAAPETVDTPVEEPEPAPTPVVEAEEPIFEEAQAESEPEERATEAEAFEAEPTVEVAETAEEEPPAASEKEVREKEDLPRLTVHTKVTPIDVVATERSVVAEALKLARELERVADLTPGDLADLETSIPSDLEEDVPAPADESTIAEPTQGVEYSKDLFAEETTVEPEESTVEGSVNGDAEEAVEEEPELIHSAIPIPTREESESESLPLVKVPTGYQEYSQLSEAMSSESLFRGTIVAIGVTDGGRTVKESMLTSVGEFVESLLTPADFGCQYSHDEFLVILPEELGAQAQRRLQYLSQRLWDFQIRTVGTQSIMFSWGAAEITDEPLRDAIEAAKDRMLQTRRTRERATSEIHHYRVRAAND
jgi:diguanylate cyclase with GGDEF domain